jgi:dTDP-glucose 4,6-dehydratase/UDP-glucose 4-epimerase
MYESYIPRHLTDPLWTKLAHARLFITGGTGLFGSWLLGSLADANQRLQLKIEATILTRNPNLAKVKMPYAEGRIRLLEGQVENFTIPNEKFDAILHMATTSAEDTFLGSSQTQKLQMLYEGTQRILELAHNSDTKRILFTSSGAVYGNQICDQIRESALLQINPLKADSALALGKSVSEFLLSQAGASTNLEIIIARCFAFVGPGMPMGLHYAIGNFINNAHLGNTIVVKGDGTSIRSYMYMGDLVWWLLKLLIDGKSGEAYNVGSDQPISILDLARKVAEVSQNSPEIVVKGQSTYSVGVPIRNIYTPSIEKAKSELGLYISTDIDSAIAQTFKALI